MSEKWIFADKELPAEGIIVNVSCMRPSLERFTDVGVMLDGYWYFAYTRTRIMGQGGNIVTHWQPLPEPYKEPS